MPTVFPCFFKALTNIRFCSGVTRPKTVYRSTASDTARWFTSCLASMYRSASLMPASRATLDTVTGLSPEMTLMSTPLSAKYRKVSGADFLIGLVR